MNTNKNPYVVCFGELLWDIFPTGAKAGGAPFNVAYHLFRMGIDVKVLSKVGSDELGDRLLQKLTNWGISTNHIQRDVEKSTGTVLANIDEHNEAHYEIIQNSAWDFIEALPEHNNLIENAAMFVFGSLITRNETSKKTLLQLVEQAKFNVFDVNFRPPYIDISLIRELLHKTNLVKVNKAEFRQIIHFSGKVYTTEKDGVKYIQDYFNVREIIITKGSRGAEYFNGDQQYFFPAVPVEIADTVGSGDSFLAGFISQRIQNKTPEEIMKQAVSLGAFITSKNGPCPDYTYNDFLGFRNGHFAKSI